ncbi:MAG: DPP IV N-terminal domain-containing protein [Dinghuibacter sp.]|nr:DPP IV N-terminal domain-containing protein [Dinghuibacter sp.]
MHQRLFILLLLFVHYSTVWAQPGTKGPQWSAKGDAVYEHQNGNIFKIGFPGMVKQTIATSANLRNLPVQQFVVSENEQQVLVKTNAQKVWRYDTRADYYVYSAAQKTIKKLGGTLPASSLMFAKLNSSGSMAAYTDYYQHNIYTENLQTGEIKQLTSDGSRKLINGTFDWVYEEEFGCRDGFRWSPDGNSIAFWQLDARSVRDYYMLNTTDSVYSQVVPVEYPKAGEDPSPCRVGVINLATGKITWMNIPGEPHKNFLPRMEWAANSTELIVQQLNRKQNESHLYICNAGTGTAQKIHTEKSDTWIDIKSAWNNGSNDGWEWMNNGKEFLWVSDKDGWRHVYRIARDGKTEQLVTRGNYDIMSIALADEAGGYLYFAASPNNATQKYLYRTRLDGSGNAERVTPEQISGTTDYEIGPNAAYAYFKYSSANSYEVSTILTLPAHQSLNKGFRIPETRTGSTEFIKIKTADGVELDGWMVKPRNFNPEKKYPVVFYVYGEPGAQTVKDEFGSSYNFLYKGDMAGDGYIYISIDNRGTPAPKGSAWRKSIYRNIGRLNIRDQAMAVKEVLKWNFVDKSRVAVWGWSGGGSTTLHLMGQYPELFTCGIAIAPVTSLFSYDNIYEERFMGLPQENHDDYQKGSAASYVKNLKGKILYVHGTGDDNVHYQNAELYLNEVIRHGKQISFFPYPNRTHNINEGDGTIEHLMQLYTDFLRANCAPGAR